MEEKSKFELHQLPFNNINEGKGCISVPMNYHSHFAVAVQFKGLLFYQLFGCNTTSILQDKNIGYMMMALGMLNNILGKTKNSQPILLFKAW